MCQPGVTTDTIDRAIAPRIERACAQPAEYLTAALGPRTDSAAERWDSAAAAIETYRHRHLGLDPAGGPSLGDAALGERPADPVAAQAWLDTHSVIGRRNDTAHETTLRIRR